MENIKYDENLNTVLGHFNIDDTSDPGAAYLAAAFDPFHDTDITNLRGVPTHTPVRSLVQRIRTTVNITKDVGLGAGNWDCLIENNPWFFYNANGGAGTQANIYSQCVDPSGHITPAIHTITSIGNAWSGVSVQQKLTATSGTIRGTAGLQSLQPPVNVLHQNLFRIVGSAFEVVNSTAKINLQGSVSTFSLSSNYTPSNFMLTTALCVPSASHHFPIPVVYVNDPPDTLEEVAVLPNTKTWKAEEGCYVVQKENAPSPPFRILGRTQIAVGGGQSASSTNIGGVYATYNGGTDALTMNGSADKSTVVFDRNYSGAWFSGLSEETTLTLTVIWYIEIVPKPDNSSLISLTSPSAPYSAGIDELYSKIALHMPTGVPVSWNKSRRWFATLKGIIGKVIRSPVLQIARSAGHILAPKQAERAEQALKQVADIANEVKQLKSAVKHDKKKLKKK